MAPSPRASFPESSNGSLTTFQVSSCWLIAGRYFDGNFRAHDRAKSAARTICHIANLCIMITSRICLIGEVNHLLGTHAAAILTCLTEFNIDPNVNAIQLLPLPSVPIRNHAKSLFHQAKASLCGRLEGSSSRLVSMNRP